MYFYIIFRGFWLWSNNLRLFTKKKNNLRLLSSLIPCPYKVSLFYFQVLDHKHYGVKPRSILIFMSNVLLVLSCKSIPFGSTFGCLYTNEFNGGILIFGEESRCLVSNLVKLANHCLDCRATLLPRDLKVWAFSFVTWKEKKNSGHEQIIFASFMWNRQKVVLQYFKLLNHGRKFMVRLFKHGLSVQFSSQLSGASLLLIQSLIYIGCISILYPSHPLQKYTS